MRTRSNRLRFPVENNSVGLIIILSETSAVPFQVVSRMSDSSYKPAIISLVAAVLIFGIIFGGIFIYRISRKTRKDNRTHECVIEILPNAKYFIKGKEATLDDIGQHLYNLAKESGITLLDNEWERFTDCRLDKGGDFIFNVNGRMPIEIPMQAFPIRIVIDSGCRYKDLKNVISLIINTLLFDSVVISNSEFGECYLNLEGDNLWGSSPKPLRIKLRWLEPENGSTIENLILCDYRGDDGQFELGINLESFGGANNPNWEKFSQYLIKYNNNYQSNLWEYPKIYIQCNDMVPIGNLFRAVKTANEIRKEPVIICALIKDQEYDPELEKAMFKNPRKE